jgi:hypothetical protein
MTSNPYQLIVNEPTINYDWKFTDSNLCPYPTHGFTLKETAILQPVIP